MSGPIQALAPGFLSLLGLKNRGQLPADLIDSVSPVIDMLPFYLMTTREQLQPAAAQNVAAVSNFAFPEYQVPPGETWWVHGYTVYVTTPAVEEVRFQACHYQPNIVPVHSSPIVEKSLSLFSGVTNTQLSATLNDFWARGRDQFGLFVNYNLGVGNVAYAELTISRFVA